MNIDLRKDFDEMTELPLGQLYRKGSVVQAWWHHDILGRPFENDSGRETWTLPNNPWGVEQAKLNFQELQKD